MQRLAVEALLERMGEELDLTVATASASSATEIETPAVSMPGLLLAGFESGFDRDRVQVLSRRELDFLDSLDAGAREAALGRLCSKPLPCVIVADGRPAPGELLDLANARSVPVFESGLPADRLVRRLGALLEDALAPTTTIHGTLVDVYGVGLLFTGRSGIGKSECGLDLVEHGHRLVADDVVHVSRTPAGHIVGSGNELLRHYMEIRGVGIIDVRAMFGVRAIRQRKRIEVEVRLVAWSDLDDYERLGIEERRTGILDVEIPQVTLPLVTGKNITVISEVIALNHLLKIRGIHSAREFDEKLKDLAGHGGPEAEIESGDSE
jgi:HPr kinase/phosphorylase